ncbi:MAG TPA: site-2 protease family protein [Acidimicrobiales bacterium]|nr:site-2 protease family protein [Acidimicrobiales bacterium]
MTDTHRGDEAPDASDPARGTGTDGPGLPDGPATGRPVPPHPPLGHGGRRGQADGAGAEQPAFTDTPAYVTSGVRLALVGVATLAFGLWAGWTPLWVILGFIVMIFLHELGHYLTAKWAGMKVTEFFIGFGPRIWSFRRGETEYGLKVVPAGAYVRIVGMNNLDEADQADEARTYRQQSFPKRLLVVSAGSIMHFLQALVLLVIALGIVGVPGGSVVDPDTTAEAWAVSGVTADSAADDAGLRSGDRIVAVDGTPVSSFDDGLRSAIATYDVNDTVSFTVERDGARSRVDATLQARPSDIEGGPAGSAFLGVGSSNVYPSDPIGLGQAAVQAPGELVRFAGQSVGALASFFSPNGLGEFADNVSRADDRAPAPGATSGSSSDDNGGENRMLSIYGAVRLGSSLSESGLAWFLLFFFQINVFIGIFNMVPLPPLDGGHAIVAIYERIRSRRGLRYHADVAKLMPLTYAVVMGLVLLGVTSLYLDIVNPVDL